MIGDPHEETKEMTDEFTDLLIEFEDTLNESNDK
jgi:hypothetical protein